MCTKYFYHNIHYTVDLLIYMYIQGTYSNLHLYKCKSVHFVSLKNANIRVVVDVLYTQVSFKLCVRVYARIQRQTCTRSETMFYQRKEWRFDSSLGKTFF